MFKVSSGLYNLAVSSSRYMEPSGRVFFQIFKLKFVLWLNILNAFYSVIETASNNNYDVYELTFNITYKHVVWCFHCRATS